MNLMEELEKLERKYRKPMYGVTEKNQEWFMAGVSQAISIVEKHLNDEVIKKAIEEWELSQKGFAFDGDKITDLFNMLKVFTSKHKRTKC